MSTKIDGVLVRLSISQFQNAKQDGALTATVKKEHSLGAKAGNWTKCKLPPESMEEIKAHVSRCRKWHYENTLPWEDGLRLLSSGAVASYENGSAKNRDIMDDLVNKFLNDYQIWIEKARAMHNGTFNEQDYPQDGKMREKFRYHYELLPVPSSGGLTLLVGKLSQKRVDELQRDLTASNELRLAEAIRDVWSRVLDPVMQLATRLTSSEVAYRGTLVAHLKELVAITPSLNITNDARLVTLASEIDTMLAGVSDESFRDSKVLVNQTASKAIGILKTFGDYGTRSFE